MIIRKMAEKIKIKDLDSEAKAEVDGYADKFIEEATKKMPKRFKQQVSEMIKDSIENKWIVRNTRQAGEISDKTGKNYSLIAPSPLLGYSTEAQADKRVETMNKAGEISRAKSRRKTVQEMESEITEDFVEEEMEEILETNSKLSDLMDELNISFGGRYSIGTGSFKERGERLDNDLDRIMNALEQDDVRAYSQEELRKLAQFITKLHKNPNKVNFEGLQPYVRSGHRDKLKEYFQLASSKIDKSVWKAVLKRNTAIDLIDTFMEKTQSTTFEKAPKRIRRAISNAIDNTAEYQSGEWDSAGGHGGSIGFTETDEEDKHEGKEPHKLPIPSSPKNLGNYIKRVPKKLKDKVYEDVSGNYSNTRTLKWKDHIER